MMNLEKVPKELVNGKEIPNRKAVSFSYTLKQFNNNIDKLIDLKCWNKDQEMEVRKLQQIAINKFIKNEYGGE